MMYDIQRQFVRRKLVRTKRPDRLRHMQLHRNLESRMLEMDRAYLLGAVAGYVLNYFTTMFYVVCVLPIKVIIFLVVHLQQVLTIYLLGVLVSFIGLMLFLYGRTKGWL